MSISAMPLPMSPASAMAAPSAQHANAVIVRAGSRSLHPNWLQGGVPEFDLYVLSYAPCPASPATTFTQEIPLPGQKVAGWNAFFKQRPEILDRYERIALIDNDIDTNASDINLAFRRGKEHALWLWQPSLTADSYFTYGIFLQNSLFSLRWVNFIEMMCPFFSAAYLKRCVGLFELGYETGIDRLWCRIEKDSALRFAVLDEISVRHTEQVGKEAYLQGFAGDTANYQTVVDRMEQRFRIVFHGPVAYAGLLRNNRKVAGRLAMATLSCAIFLGYGRSVIRKWFFKAATDHVRHNLTRPIDADDLTKRNVLNVSQHDHRSMTAIPDTHDAS